MRIGFDLDRIFIQYPPIVPGELIDWLYKSHNTKHLTYRIPTNPIEILIRKISHFPGIRQPIIENVEFVKSLAQKHRHELYLISSRYDFLEKITHELLNKLGLNQAFDHICLNTQNKQAHIFKEEIIRKNKIEVYIDDDNELLMYLNSKLPTLKTIRYIPGISLEKHLRDL